MSLVLRPLEALSDELGLHRDDVIPWGRHRAKVSLDALSVRPGASPGRLVLVSAINPTPAGEGKTTMSVALAMGLAKRGRRAVAALREPSLGPVFGVKGGGTGGGRATLEPAQDINLHFTGDLHAVTSAHNLLAAVADNALHFRDPVNLDPRSVRWRRALDMNDRALRHVVLGMGRGNGPVREGAFDITAASEVMAILCLASGPRDLERRLARIVVGTTPAGKAVTAGDLGAAPAMTALLMDALLPNLVQTREGTPAVVHGGPFGNIAHGCNSLLGTRLALAYGQDVITEAGFGFDLGAEKFLDIKCRVGDLWPHGVVLVVTHRALKMHGGVPVSRAGEPDPEALRRGLDHLGRHLDTLETYGLPCVVCVNGFPQDTAEEGAVVRSYGIERSVAVARCEGFARGGEGSLELADAVLTMLSSGGGERPAQRFMYEPSDAPAVKIEKVARGVYGAEGVTFTAQAQKDLASAVALGGGELPVCIAKTHLSLTDDPSKVGRPRGFTLTVREVRLSAGAGYLVPLTGEIMTMPGLPREPAARRVVVHDDGRVTGLMQGE
ncbi:MAG: formate--tetrahydrofolate ligase [Deltaproteobacteria bacterium]|nr:formate--tetrahydrofolate ligase [Deltaproteobacteria bacterium]